MYFSKNYLGSAERHLGTIALKTSSKKLSWGQIRADLGPNVLRIWQIGPENPIYSGIYHWKPEKWVFSEKVGKSRISGSGPLNSGGCPYRPLLAGSRGEMPTGGPGPFFPGTPLSWAERPHNSLVGNVFFFEIFFGTFPGAKCQKSVQNVFFLENPFFLVKKLKTGFFHVFRVFPCFSTFAQMCYFSQKTLSGELSRG